MIFKKKTLYFALLFAVVLGMAASDLDAVISRNVSVEGTHVVTGRVKDDNGGVYILEDLTIDGTEMNSKARFRSTESLTIGDELTIDGKVTTFKEDVFDAYSAQLYSDEIYYEVTNPTSLQRKEGTRKWSERAKLRITEGMRGYLSEENVGMMKSLLFGDKSELTKEDKTTINGIGVAHVFAVSGLHVGFLAMLLAFLLRKARVNPFVRIGITTLFLLFYGAMTGFPAGVKRALIMYVVSAVAVLLGRKNDPLTSLAIASGLILLTHPRELFDVGYIMSVAAVLGMVCFYRPIYSMFAKITKNRIVNYLFKLIATTFSANLFVLPVSFNVFNKVSLYSLLSNMLLLPILSVVFPVAAIIGILTLAWLRLGVLYTFIGYAMQAVRTIASFVYSLPYAEITVSGLGWLTVLYVAVLVFVSPFFLVKREYKYSALGVLGVAFILFAFL